MPWVQAHRYAVGGRGILVGGVLRVACAAARAAAVHDWADNEVGEMIHEGEDFVYISCWKCKVHYFLPRHLYRSAKQNSDIWFHCPYGHKAHYPDGETSEEIMRRERDQARQQLARAEEETRLASLRADKAERAHRKLKKRAAAGTCPCCQRTFSNMSVHMRQQHPEYVAENVVKLDQKRA